MQKTVRSFAFGAALAGLFAVLVLGTWRVSDWLAERLIAQSAGAAAQGWSRFVTASLPAEDPPVGSEDVVAEGLARTLDDGRRAAGIARFRVYDMEGHLRLASDDFEASPAGDVLPAADIARVAARETPFWIGEAAPSAKGPTLTRVLTTLGEPSAPFGVLEIDLDQSEIRDGVIGLLRTAGAALTAFVLIGFWVPLFGLLRRDRARQAADRRVEFLSRHDAMTSLANRAQFTDRVDAMLQRRGSVPDETLAVFYIDLKRLKMVNDVHGYDAGDAIVGEVAADLVRIAGPRAAVARLGGDEFCVAAGLCADAGPIEVCVHAFATMIVEAIARPRSVAGDEVTIAASVGVALASPDARSGSDLIKNAHLALTHAKRLGPNGRVLFDRKMHDDLQQRRDLERRIRDAVENDSFDLHFQPVLHVRDGRLTGFEALLRLPQSSGGFVSPALFVPIAEEMGLISQIGNWVIRRACAFAADWPEALSVAVNLSPAQFKDGGVCDAVRDALAETGLTPRRLELEITEGLLMSDADAIMLELAALKAMGVSIVMDDFGTGYSSLSYLWKFPFDKIKIDRSFMRALDQKEGHVADGKVADMLAAIMSLSRSLRLRVTAEGVETSAQADFVKLLACDEVQGFLFGRPMPMADVAATILKDSVRLEESKALDENTRLPVAALRGAAG